MSFTTLIWEQKINTTKEKLWDFIATPRNLKIITPEYMGFNIITKDLPEKMYQGLIIAYKVKPLIGIELTWVSEITHINEFNYFIDEQKIGPYKFWHHTHIIEQISEGILMKDILNYKPPLSFLGSIANELIIKKKLDEIFAYRRKKIEEIFT
ncbi:MAG: SRPBCC family protein [Ignavibacteria bacterium]|nr:SRPBCC family protein [Ignavibacteria bacterium]